MSKLIRSDFVKKFNFIIPSFKNFEEVKKMDAPLIVNGLDEFMKLRLPTWKKLDNCIEKKYEFEDFQKTFGFMTQVAIIAEDIDHHPEWANVYNKLQVRLNSHYCNGVTMKDLFLAFTMDKLEEKSSQFTLRKDLWPESGTILKNWNE